MSGHVAMAVRMSDDRLSGVSMDQISTTVATVLSEYFKSSERTIFWDDDLKKNIDPFDGLQGGFFAADWDFKVCNVTAQWYPQTDVLATYQLKILRQLVELQLSHAVEIKQLIDRAWGVSQNKHKKKDASTAPPDPTDPNSQERLQLIPIGQDCQRKRFWVADGPCTFVTLSSRRKDPPICVYLRDLFFSVSET